MAFSYPGSGWRVGVHGVSGGARSGGCSQDHGGEESERERKMSGGGGREEERGRLGQAGGSWWCIKGGGGSCTADHRADEEQMEGEGMVRTTGDVGRRRIGGLGQERGRRKRWPELVQFVEIFFWIFPIPKIVKGRERKDKEKR